jgi:hypothetical protein
MELEKLKNIMNKYGDAWENQNPSLLVSLFEEDGTYQVTPFEEPMQGHIVLKEYWREHPQQDQKNIKFSLGQCGVFGEMGYAEWVCTFGQVSSGKLVELKGIMIITMPNDKIKSLREYWHSSEKVNQ